MRKDAPATGGTGRSGASPARSTRFYAAVSIAAALATVGLKAGAYVLTGSVGLLSDAAESSANLVAAIGAFWALSAAARPPDEEHAYGHTKAEFFSSALEGALVLAAAAFIAATAVGRLFEPQPLENVGAGLVVSLVAAVLNGVVGLVLLRAGGRLRSAALRADGRHLLTDVWTTAGVVAGVLLVGWTGWLFLDPLIALVVAANIVWVGLRILNEAAHGLLDTALPPEDLRVVEAVISRYRESGIEFHALRTRSAGARRFVSMHVLVPGSWSVRRGHDLSEDLEREVVEELPMTTVFVHLEPLEDESSFRDQGLDRPDLEEPPPGS
ncbi:cation diffusion facilitator family transporter [Rubrobacter marinus]|uniref:Cation diffusion facilitator family transporter n=1 Tax=Rubrobacter marinus TaxID=2653852 RepID=A0A6G8Q2Y2_9ACTN|nr:cation diffusion facilitator family transporter [Rubrobacter marinus]